MTISHNNSEDIVMQYWVKTISPGIDSGFIDTMYFGNVTIMDESHLKVAALSPQGVDVILTIAAINDSMLVLSPILGSQ